MIKITNKILKLNTRIIEACKPFNKNILILNLYF